jgi:hypothetical protein
MMNWQLSFDKEEPRIWILQNSPLVQATYRKLLQIGIMFQTFTTFQIVPTCTVDMTSNLFSSILSRISKHTVHPHDLELAKVPFTMEQEL